MEEVDRQEGRRREGGRELTTCHGLNFDRRRRRPSCRSGGRLRLLLRVRVRIQIPAHQPPGRALHHHSETPRADPTTSAQMRSDVLQGAHTRYGTSGDLLRLIIASVVHRVQQQIGACLDDRVKDGTLARQDPPKSRPLRRRRRV